MKNPFFMQVLLDEIGLCIHHFTWITFTINGPHYLSQYHNVVGWSWDLLFQEFTQPGIEPTPLKFVKL